VYIAWYLPIKATVPSFVIVDDDASVNMSRGQINGVVTTVEKL
jgi:hypothetical protein